MESWTFDGMATDHQTHEHYPYHLSMVHDPESGDLSLAWSSPDGTRLVNLVAGDPDARMLTDLFEMRRSEREPADR